MLKTQVYDSRTSVRENVEYVLRDKDGNIKPLFQDNALCVWLMENSYLSPLWINQWYAPLLMPFLGHWATSKQVSNLITNAGRGLISGLINGSGSPAAATYIAVGTGTTAAAGDTTLQTESSTSGLSRAAGTVSLVTTSVTNDTAQVTKTFSVTGTVAVTEAGLLNASSNGTLLCRQVFSAVNVVNTDSLQITWKVQNA
jgi:hypothetical protein